MADTAAEVAVGMDMMESIKGKEMAVGIGKHVNKEQDIKQTHFVERQVKKLEATSTSVDTPADTAAEVAVGVDMSEIVKGKEMAVGIGKHVK